VAVSEARLDNVTTLESSGTKTGLPPSCCDGVFLRRAYHHLTDQIAIAADLFAGLRPGGRLAIIDFEPNRWLSLISSVEGMPESRIGHGVDPGVVVAELAAAGFVLDARHDGWGAWNYYFIFIRPES
jgi:predicted methyltransferase